MRHLLNGLLLATATLFADCRVQVVADIFPEQHNAQIRTAVSGGTVDIEPLSLPGVSNLLRTDETNQTVITHTFYNPEAINPGYVMLLDSWLPDIEELCSYETEITLPVGFTAVSEYDTQTVTDDGIRTRYRFTMKRPIDRISVVASPDFVQNKTEFGSISIETYFFSRHARLSEQYLQKAQSYLQMYASRLGPYPYRRFAIVENLFQTGYSMPTYTLIGDHLLDKSYLLERSLGHEIVHQWFGNGVFNDFDQGNWVEGLATYLSDHDLQAVNGDARFYRKQTLDGFMNSVTELNDFSLINFHHRVDRASMHIGYGKGMFLFHMLRNKMGAKAFDAALKALVFRFRHRYADYNDLLAHFSSFSDRPLKPFFYQWLYARGLLDITVASARYDRKKQMLSFELQQHDRQRPFDVDVPVTLLCGEERTVHNVRLERLRQSFTLRSSCPVDTLLIDEEYHLLRTLDRSEKLLSFGSMEKLESVAVVGADEQSYETLQTFFASSILENGGEAASFDLDTRPVLYVNTPFTAASTPSFQPIEGDIAFQIVADTKSGLAPRMHLRYDEGGLEKLAKRLRYYKPYAAIALKGDRSIVKTLPQSTDGIRVAVEID